MNPTYELSLSSSTSGSWSGVRYPMRGVVWVSTGVSTASIPVVKPRSYTRAAAARRAKKSGVRYERLTNLRLSPRVSRSNLAGRTPRTAGDHP